MDGNSTIVDPINNQNGTPSNGASGSSEGAGSVDLAQEVKTLKEQYSNSSREAHKLVEELKQEREARIRLEGSLKTQQQQTAQPGYPDEESYVKHYTEKGLDPEAARSLYRESRATYENQSVVYKKLQAMENLLQYQRSESERVFEQTNPEAQKASEFWKDVPAMSNLSVGDKIAEMKKVQAKLGLRVEGRDTTAAKLAASGSGSGSGVRGGEVNNTSSLDAEAKSAGFSSWKQLEEAGKATTPTLYAEYKRRWNLK